MKRKANEAFENSYNDWVQSVIKKAKAAEKDPIPQRSWNVFRASHDQGQFEQMYRTLKTSELVQSSGTPSRIMKEIAMYATGSVHQCSNPDCDEVVVHLSEDALHDDRSEDDYDAFDGDPDPSHESYVFDQVSDKFYCRHCAVHLKWCFWRPGMYDEGDHGHYVFPPGCWKCASCKGTIHDCHGYDHAEEPEDKCEEGEYKECEFCSAIVCADGYCSFECRECGGRFCSNCAYDGNDDWNIEKCGECRNE